MSNPETDAPDQVAVDTDSSDAPPQVRRVAGHVGRHAEPSLPNPDGLEVTRRFTTADTDPVDLFDWKYVDAVLTDNNTGKAIFEMPAVEVPADWEYNSIVVLASKYFRKAGVPQYDDEGNPIVDDDGNPKLGPERSAKQWAYRLANAWMIWGQRYNYFATDTDAEAFRDELVYMLLAQMASPNSPQHFNTGIYEAYGLEEDPEGNWYVDPDTREPRKSAHKYERSTANACFILGAEDQLVSGHAEEKSIFQTIQDEARLFKGGSGSGWNASVIRAEGEPLTGGGTASGVMSFLKVADYAAGAIKSGGRTRRAAKMVVLDVDHPEVEDFIWCKVKEEEKVAALAAGGYSTDWADPEGAYAIVGFQNANHSVRLTEKFMRAVRDDLEFDLIGRVTGEAMKTVNARNLFRQIAEAAHTCADPGVQFHDIVNDWHTAKADDDIDASNPCSEYMYLDDTACNLASLNLTKYFDDETQTFDLQSYDHAVRLWTMVLEITVMMSHYPSKIVAERSFEHRTLGLGFASIGALLMRAGLPYDSEEGRSVMGALTAYLTMKAYETSAEMARAVGQCDAYGRNQQHVTRVLRNHARAAVRNSPSIDKVDLGLLGGLSYEGLSVEPQALDYDRLNDTPFGVFTGPLAEQATRMLAANDRHGLRNMQASVIAPTGTIALQMACDTTGPEPDFSLVKFKTLAGGGIMKIVNRSLQPALRALGYDNDEVDAIVQWAVGTGTLDSETVVRRSSLLARGLSEQAVDRIERAVPNAPNLQSATSAVTVGREALYDLGLSDEDIDADEFDVLTHLGFSADEIESSSKVICGRHTVEGAPQLKPEHLPVFDCANYCGPDGTRVIHWSGHVKAMGALAPFLSGSASKTINMPTEATVDEIEQAYQLCYDLGIKALSIYRDNSKLSQVLAGRKSDEDDNDQPHLLNADEIELGMSPKQFWNGQKPPQFRLPPTAYGPRWKLKIGETGMMVRVGEYPDGTPGEIFIDLSKEGSTLKGVVSCFAIAVSKALQWGVPLEELVEQFSFHSFEPNGHVLGDDNLKMCNSIIDAVFRKLAYHYLGQDNMVHAPYDLEDGETVAAAAAKASGYDHALAARTADASDTTTKSASKPAGESNDAPFCPRDGSRMVRNGACYLCHTCGDTSGCS